jgi:hypothetical protein
VVAEPSPSWPVLDWEARWLEAKGLFLQSLPHFLARVGPHAQINLIYYV